MTYQTHGAFNETPLALFTSEAGYSSSGLKPGCGWRDSGGVVRVGTWLDEWQQIEATWDWNRLGTMKGARPNMIYPNELQIPGATIVMEGVDPVYHIGSGETFTIDFLRRTITDWAIHGYLYNPGTRNGRDAYVAIYDAADGSIPRTANSPALPLPQALLPDGSYTVFAQYRGVREGLRLPDEYIPNPEYYYIDGNGQESYFDPYVFIGEIPADPQNPLNVIRAELVATNTQEDNQEYQGYVTTEKALDGRGSAIKLQVGGGTWAAAPGVFVTPARPLFELDFTTPETLPEGVSPSTLIPLSTDPMAHVINFAITTRKEGIWGGKVLLGGSRFSNQSVRPALWQWNESDNTLEPLGTAEQACLSYCETAMSIGIITGLKELDDGSIIVLTMCSRHIYDSSVIPLEQRLRRWPLATDGEPGGRSITAVAGKTGTRIIHTAGSGGGYVGDEVVMTGNSLLDIQGDDLIYAPGTLANVDGALWRHRGKAYGACILGNADKYGNFGDEPNQFITFYDGTWNKDSAGWKPSELALQRGASINGMNVTFGWIPNSETAQVIRDDGNTIRVLSSDYRVRQGTITNNATSANLQSYIMPAQKVVDDALQSGWALIEVDGGFDGNHLPVENPPSELVAGYKWRVLELPAYTPIYAAQIRDMMPQKYFQSSNADANNTTTGVWLRVDSTADLDDFSSYVWRPFLDRPFVLPIAANVKIEMLVITHAPFAPEQLPAWGAT